MQFGHVIRHKTGQIASKNAIKHRRIIVSDKLTNYKIAIVGNALRTIHNNNKLTSFFDNKRIVLLIVIFRETENNITSILTSTFNRKDRKSLDTIYFKFPLIDKFIKTLPAILRDLLGGVRIHQSLSKMSNSILIIESCYEANTSRLSQFSLYSSRLN